MSRKFTLRDKWHLLQVSLYSQRDNAALGIILLIATAAIAEHYYETGSQMVIGGFMIVSVPLTIYRFLTVKLH